MITVDLRRYRCPSVYIKVAQHCDALKSGELIQFVLDKKAEHFVNEALQIILNKKITVVEAGTINDCSYIIVER